MATPTQLNSNLWLQGDAGLYSDTARTVVATQGAAVAALTDFSGAGNHCPQNSLANRPKANLTGGVLSLEYGQDQSIDLPANYPIDARAFSLFFICDLVNLRRPWVGNSNYSYHTFIKTTNSKANFFYDSAGLLQCYDGSFKISVSKPPTSRALIGIVCSATEVRFYINGTYSSTAPLNAGTDLGGTLGGFLAGSGNVFPLAADIRDLFAFNRALSDNEVQSLLPYAVSRGVSLNYTGVLVVDGDSISAGIGAALNKNYLRQLTLPPTVRTYNLGESAIFMQTLASEAPARANPLFEGGKTNSLLIFAGTNDLDFGGRTPAQVYEDVKTRCQSAIASGVPAANIIVVTMLPRDNDEANRVAYNNLIRGDASGIGYRVADVASNPQIGQNGQNANATYYVDRIHPTSAGYAIISSYVQPHLNAILSVTQVTSPPQIMSTTFGHGRGAGTLLGGRDLTRHSTDFNYGADLDQAEQTCLQAPGGAKEFLYGNVGASAGIDGRLSKSRAEVERELAATYGKEDDSRLFALAPFGFEPGNWAIQFLTKKQTYRLTGGTTSAVGTGGTFQADGATRVGTMLQAPRVQGGVSVLRNEIDILAFNGVDPNQFFALRNTLTATKGADFRLTTYIAGGVVNGATLCAFVKAQVETLYPGRIATVTVTNAFALSGGLWSGTVQISFDGTANLAPLDVVSGAVRRRQVVNGDAGTYSFDGSTARVLPIPQATFDADQKALDTAHAGSVSIGSSAALVNGPSLVTGGTAFGNPGSTGHAGAFTATNTDQAFESLTTNGTGFLGYDRGAGNAVIANSYYLQTFDPQYDGAGTWPKNWTFEGSNDNASWTVLDTRNGVIFSSQETKTFNFASQTAYRYYRINVTVNESGGGGVVIRNMGIAGAQTPANLDFTTYFPTAATPGGLTKGGTGSGSTNTALALAGSLATTLTGATAQEGGAFNGINLLSSATTGTAVKTAAAPHQNGATLDLHAPFSVGTLAAPIIVEHAPDVSGAPGAWATLGTFTPITDASDRTQTAQRVVVAAGTTVNPWKRYRLPTLTGQIAIAVIAADQDS